MVSHQVGEMVLDLVAVVRTVLYPAGAVMGSDLVVVVKVSVPVEVVKVLSQQVERVSVRREVEMVLDSVLSRLEQDL